MGRRDNNDLEALREALKHAQSATVRERVVAYVSEDKSRVKALMDFFFDPDMRTHQRAAWIVGRVGELTPEVILPYADRMIENLGRPVHDAVVRNTMRVFSKMEIPKACEGALYELAFGYLLDVRQPVAIRVFSMTVAAQIALRHEALIPELSDVIKMIIPQGSPGLKSRGRKIVKLLDKA